MYSEGLFSSNFNLDLLYYFLFAAIISAAIFLAFAILGYFKKKNGASTKTFNVIKTFRVALEGFCWFLPVAAFLKLSTQDILFAVFMTAWYFWPLLVATSTANITYKITSKKFNDLVPKRIEIGFSCFLIIAIIAEELYVHTIYNS